MHSHSCNLGERTLTLSDLDFPKTFRASDYIEGSNPGFSSFTLNYTPSPSPILITEIHSAYIDTDGDFGTPIKLSTFAHISTTTNITSGYLSQLSIPPSRTLVQLTAYYRSDGSIFCYSLDSIHNTGTGTLVFRLTINSSLNLSYAKQVYYYVFDSSATRVLLSLMASVSGRLIPVGSVLSQESSSSPAHQTALSSAEAIIPASYYKLDLEFSPYQLIK